MVSVLVTGLRRPRPSQGRTVQAVARSSKATTDARGRAGEQGVYGFALSRSGQFWIQQGQVRHLCHSQQVFRCRQLIAFHPLSCSSSEAPCCAPSQIFRASCRRSVARSASANTSSRSCPRSPVSPIVYSMGHTCRPHRPGASQGIRCRPAVPPLSGSVARDRTHRDRYMW